MKKAELRTGNRSRGGFTLVETLLAVLILSSGILFVMPAFFRSGGILVHLGCRYEAEILVNNLIAENEMSLRLSRRLDSRTLTGKKETGGMVYSYELDLEPQDSRNRLYRLTAKVRWNDIKSNQLIRSAYILR